MARPANPYGDPVSIRRKGSRYKIRFYPTGIITSPNDRKEVPGAYPTAEEATAAAAVLRAKLVEHRDRFRPECGRSSVLVSTAAAEFVSDGPTRWHVPSHQVRHQDLHRRSSDEV